MSRKEYIVGQGVDLLKSAPFIIVFAVIALITGDMMAYWVGAAMFALIYIVTRLNRKEDREHEQFSV